MSEFKQYRRTGLSEMRPYVEGEDLTGVSVSDADRALPTLAGGYIARNPKNHADTWYVAQKYFAENLEEVPAVKVEKTLGNTTANGAKKNVKDIQFWGNGDTFLLVSKASSQQEGWMKSTKALPTLEGCIIQVTTQQRNPDGSYTVAEALSFAPNTLLRACIKKVDGTIIDPFYCRESGEGLVLYLKKRAPENVYELQPGEEIIGRYIA